MYNTVKLNSLLPIVKSTNSIKPSAHSRLKLLLNLVLGKLKSMRLQFRVNHFHIFSARKLQGNWRYA